jgi:hypothetical protein
MPAPRWLKFSWQSCCACTRGACRLARWSLWLLLIILAGVQIAILATRELHVPQFVLREIETRLAASGLQVEFGDATFDPTGRLLLRDAELRLQTVEDPIMRARAIYLEVDPLALWFDELAVRHMRVDGVDLVLPAVFSPSGQAEPVLDDLSASFHPNERQTKLMVDHATARLGPVRLAVRGILNLPDLNDGQESLRCPQLEDIIKYYPEFCRQTRQILARLPAMEEPMITIDLSSESQDTQAKLRLQAASLALPRPSGYAIDDLSFKDLRISTRFDLSADASLTPLEFAMGQVSGPDGLTVHDMQGTLHLRQAKLSAPLRPARVEMQATALRFRQLNLTALAAQAQLMTLPVVQAQATASWADEPWRIDADLDLLTQAGRVELAGELGAAVLPWVAEITGIDVPALLAWDISPYLEVNANLGPGARPLRAEAAWQTGPVVARRVPLDATAAQLHWSGHDLRVPDLLLRCGTSLAQGSYTMDTESLVFRFLLNGQLDPPAIQGWFRDWWPRFWRQFEFRADPPAANVEVSGRWKVPLETRVFVSADARDASIREIAMERMRTRLFVRPGWADVLHFVADRRQGTIEGRFARQWKLPDSRRWTRIEIDAAGRTDLSPAPKLMPQGGAALIAPFAFTEPLELELRGTATREDIGQPIQNDFTVRGRGEGPWTYAGFPLENVSFTARRLTDLVQVEQLSAQLAGGKLSGRFELSGPAENRQLAFDLNLQDAALGRAIHDVASWTAQRRGEEPSAATDFEKQAADARLLVSLTAEGPAQDALALQGTGSAAVTGANLGNINLLGILSSLLERTVLNFSTLQLDHAYADFQLAGPRLIFPELKITGPRGAVDANGTYSMENGILDFTTRVRPFEGGEGLLDAVFSPLSAVFEVKLAGELADPEWTFVFGPTNLLRNLTGENSRSTSPNTSTTTPPFVPTPPADRKPEPPPPAKSVTPSP